MGRLTNEQIEFIKNNVGTLTNQEIANKLNCSKSTVSNWRKKLGISFSKLHDFSKYTQYIIDNYNIKTSKKIAEEIGCSKGYVTQVWRENGLKGKTNRVYYSNFSYFNQINSPTKAYILGLICSDGCIYTRKNHEGLWQITLKRQDGQILEDIKQEIESENAVKYKDNTATLTIVSQEMYDNLIRIGITPRKTYTMDLSKVIQNIPIQYQKDFIHGYFDGDGSITVRNIPSKSKVQFAMPEYFMEPFQKMLLSLGIKSNWNRDKRTYKYTIPFGSLVINGASNKYCLLQLMLFENTISIQRKTQLCQQLCEQIQSNKTNRSENIIAVEKWEELLGSLRR